MSQVKGDSPNDDGVVGSTGAGDKAGVFGFAQQGTGLRGITRNSGNFGIFGSNDSTNPPAGGGAGGAGVFGLSNCPGGAGVFGANNTASGVGVQGNGPDAGLSGFSDKGVGVRAHSNHANAVEGFAHVVDQTALFGMNDAHGTVTPGLNRPAGNGVWGHTRVEQGSGVVGSAEPGLTQAAGVTGLGAIAGRFVGKVVCTSHIEAPQGTVTCFDVALAGADCAEEFDLAGLGTVPPGSVMCFDPDGRLVPSAEAYDRHVAGVVSGAGPYKPGITLDRQAGRANRAALALVGKVCCLADASHGAIAVGDLLTTSPTPGHAMKAADRDRAFGSVIGKAMGGLAEGRGLIPVLVALR